MKKSSLLLFVVFLLTVMGCATQQTKVEKGQYTGKETDTVTFSVYKQKTLDGLGAFEFNRKKNIYETIDKLANQLRASPKYTVLKKKEVNTFDSFPILVLVDRDADGKGEGYAYLPKGGGHTDEFGLMFDLNKDGKIDYIVFNGGIMITKDFKKAFWMNYHWIDSNHDGKIDIMVYNDIDLDGDNFADEGITAWIYDSDFDGIIDKAEYLGEGFEKDIEKKEGVFIIKRAFGRELKLEGKSFPNMMLSDINSMYP